MTVQAILDRKGSNVFSIHPDATVKDAADQMRERGVAALVVQSDHVIKGIVSERDVVSAVSRFGERALSMTVGDIFTLTIITIAPDDSINHATSLMTRHHVRQLPVIADGRLLGIISIGDIVKHRLDDLETESNSLRDLYFIAR